MASSTIQLSRTLLVTSQFIRNAPLTFTSPVTTNDPGFSNADWVRQFILGPPFAWRWNRGTANFTCVIGQSDYPLSVPTFGWLEKASFTDPTNGNQPYEFEIALDLTPGSPQLPSKIAAFDDDGEGNITFRVFPAPDQEYPVTLLYQNAAPLFVATSDTWSPIPDWQSFLYNQGMLAKAYEYMNDDRYVGAMQLFLQQVVMSDNGLTESQKSIFLEDRINMVRQNIGVQATARRS